MFENNPTRQSATKNTDKRNPVKFVTSFGISSTKTTAVLAPASAHRTCLVKTATCDVTQMTLTEHGLWNAAQVLALQVQAPPRAVLPANLIPAAAAAKPLVREQRFVSNTAVESARNTIVRMDPGM